MNHLQFRMDLFFDNVLQPFTALFVEYMMWAAVFASLQATTLLGFSKEQYLAYAVWASFAARTNANWTYQHKMIRDIESGQINSIIVRPMSFYDYYLGQFLGYTLFRAIPSLVFPAFFCVILKLPFYPERLWVAVLVSFCYLIFIYTLGFCVSCIAFWLTKVNSFVAAINIGIWTMSGELFPIDLVPQPLQSILLKLPFVNAVYIPIGYLTGRFDATVVATSIGYLALAIMIAMLIAYYTWHRGLKSYVGTGA